MVLSRKSYGEEVFVIFGGAIHSAKITGTNQATGRDHVVGFKVYISTATDRWDQPVSTDIRKRNVFKDEEEAKKTFFIRTLEGEYNE